MRRGYQPPRRFGTTGDSVWQSGGTVVQSPRVAMVTGAANGIGRAIVDRFLADGYSVAGVDLAEDDLGTAATDLDADRFHPVVADISNRAEVSAAVHVA